MRGSVDVHNYLLERDIKHEVFNVGGRIRSPDRIAALLDLPPDEVGKVVVFDGGKLPVAAVVPANTDPDPALVREAASDEGLEPARPSRTAELTDYLPEATPPVGLPPGFVVVMDEGMTQREVLYFVAGDPAAVLKVRGEDLAGAAGAITAKIAG